MKWVTSALKWRFVSLCYVAIWLAVFAFLVYAITRPQFFTLSDFAIFGGFFSILAWVGIFGQFALGAFIYLISPRRFRTLMD